MSMARLDFDFHTPSRRPGVLALTLALTGAAALIWAWSNLHAARAEHDTVTTQLAAIEQEVIEQSRSRTAAQSGSRGKNTAETAQARVAAQLDYSWEPAIAALATARSRQIALVALDGVQAKRQLKLIAEARRLADAIDFIDALQQQPGIKRATLVQHSIQSDDAEKPVRFNILVELNA